MLKKRYLFFPIKSHQCFILLEKEIDFTNVFNHGTYGVKVPQMKVWKYGCKKLIRFHVLPCMRREALMLLPQTNSCLESNGGKLLGIQWLHRHQVYG